MNERTFRRTFLCLLYAVAALIFFIPSSNPSAYSAQVTLQWDPNEGEGERVAGYRVYYGTESGDYENFIDVGHRTECEISGLEKGKTYFFAAKAYDAAGWESDFSNEVGIYEKSLFPGWNLISLPLQPFDTSIGEVLKSISTNVYFVMGFKKSKCVELPSGRFSREYLENHGSRGRILDRDVRSRNSQNSWESPLQIA